jgi:hypothetical protein
VNLGHNTEYSKEKKRRSKTSCHYSTHPVYVIMQMGGRGDLWQNISLLPPNRRYCYFQRAVDVPLVGTRWVCVKEYTVKRS